MRRYVTQRVKFDVNVTCYEENLYRKWPWKGEKDEYQSTLSRSQNLSPIPLLPLAQVFMRETPKWLPHATANKPKGQKKEGGSPSRRLEHGADRIQTISDSQRKFAAQFSLSAAEKEAEGEENVRIRSGNRWASKPGHSQKCPGGSRWSIEYQPQGSVGGPATVSRMPQEAQTNGSLSRSDVCDKGRLQSDHPEGAQTDQKKDYAKMELGQESEGLVFGGRVRADEEAKGERWSKECDPTDGGKNKPKISAWSKATVSCCTCGRYSRLYKQDAKSVNMFRVLLTQNEHTTVYQCVFDSSQESWFQTKHVTDIFFSFLTIIVAKNCKLQWPRAFSCHRCKFE